MKEKGIQGENKMGVMPVPQLVISMSFPIMISMLVQSLYNIVDSIFVAKISEEALTATSIAYSAQMLQIAVAVGTGVGVNSLVSRRLGAKQFDKANEAATTGLLLTLFSSIVFIIWGIWGTRAFVQMFTDDQQVLDFAISYLRICQIFSTGIFLGTLTQRLLQATGRTVLSMLAQMAGAIVNIILDPIMIFGLGGFPEMGITGAAIATVLGQWTSAILGLILNYVQNREIRFVWKGFRFPKDTIIAIYKVGAPTIFMQAFGSIMVAVMNKILILYSLTAVAFFGVYFKLQNFLFMPMNGLGQGSLPIAAYNLGARQYDRMKETCKIAIMTGAGISLIGTAVFLVFPKQLLLLFSASKAMIAIGVPALRIISISFVFASVTMITGYLISGLGNGMVNMIGTALRQIVILLPAVLILGWMGGIEIIWYSFWISEGCAFLFAIYHLKKKLSY
ncbi:MAG: MATE family efflux transporter [Lachnospiraceae bacterium]|nr:MATE family efflux transporter [Lachnospiraceae bacterium]